MRIAVDAMGGDGGPAVNVAGALGAAREDRLEVILVGDQVTIERELARQRTHARTSAGIAIRHASQVVEMGELPSHALRRKRDSSMRVAATLVRDGEADAFVSAGNTGAAMAIAMFTLGVLPGADRPAIAIVLPNLKGRTVLQSTFTIDVVAMVFGMPRVLFPALAIGRFHRGAAGVGWMLSAVAIGALVGALTSGWVARVRRWGLAIIMAVSV